MQRLFVLSFALLCACGLQPNTVTDTESGDTGSVLPVGTTVAELQGGLVSPGEVVTLNRVIATTGLTADGKGFFVQDAGGGEFSGLYVYLQSGGDDVQVEPGLELSLTGEVKEFPEEEAETETELVVSSATNVVVTGTGEITVDPVEVAAITDWEAWESCMISVGPAEVTEGINNYGEVTLDNGLKMDNLFFDFEADAGDSFTNVTAVLGYKWSEWKLLPRGEDDLEGYVAQPAPEPTAGTIAEIQAGDFALDALVSISGVIATSQTTSGNFYVQEVGGGENSGLYIYAWDEAETEITLGDVLDIEGYVTEYETDDSSLTELTVKEAGKIQVTSQGASVTVDTLDAASVVDWEVWEGCLVQLGTLTTTTAADDHGTVGTDAGISLDDQFYSVDVVSGTTFASVTGLISDYYGWKLNPRDENDLVSQ